MLSGLYNIIGIWKFLLLIPPTSRFPPARHLRSLLRWMTQWNVSLRVANWSLPSHRKSRFQVMHGAASLEEMKLRFCLYERGLANGKSSNWWCKADDGTN